MLAHSKDLDVQWTQLRDTLIYSAETTVGRRRGTFKERWIQDRSWTLSDQQRNAKKKVREQAPNAAARQDEETKYNDQDQQVKRSCRRDKREWLDRKGVQEQEAANRNDSKKLFRIIRELAGSVTGRGVPIKEWNGKPLLTKEEQNRRWVEHFQQVLNQLAPVDRVRP